MSNLSKIKPINTKILFQFVEDVDCVSFKTVSNSGIVLVENQSEQVKTPRWGKVLAVGDQIENEEVSVGEYILIEPLGWTNAMSLESTQAAEKFWFTQLDKIMCVSDTLPETI